jgi:hypothetical protein
VAKLEKKADQGRGAPKSHLNVAGVKPFHVKQPSLQNNAMNPIATGEISVFSIQ